MIVVGLTGGIGSGKTTVAKEFHFLGIPIYIADEEAKKLMNTSKTIRRKLIGLFGTRAYEDGILNRPFIADIIFKDKDYLYKMNSIVHPKVAQHFKRWFLKQNAPYVIKESAILFENGGYKQCDFVITVTAPKEIRIKRLLVRDKTTKDKIVAIMGNQWSDEDKVRLSQFVITNTSLEKTKEQVLQVHNQLLKNIG